MLSASYLASLGIENIINYTRKSRQDEEMEKRTGEDTLKAQNELMERILAPLGIPYDQRPELGSGDKIATRPVFQSVIEDLRKGKYQAIAVKEISRMGRGSYTDMGVIYDLLNEKRIFVITPWKVYDPKNQADLRQIRFELFMSREEFETTRERLMGGRISNAMEGRWVAGAAPFGFTYNSNTRKLEINEEEAKTIRAIFDWYVNGVPTDDGKRRDVSFRALSTYLRRKTLLKTPKGLRDWQPTQLKQLIINERYIGTMRFRTTQRIGGKQVPRPEEEHIVVPNAIPAIIDMDTWEKAQAKVNDSSTKPRNKLEFAPCELASIAVCKTCGRKMIRQYSIQHYKKRDGSGDVSVYHKEFLWCTTPGCTFVKYRAVEEDLIEVLRYFQDLDSDLLASQIALVLEERKDSGGLTAEDITKHIEQREKELKQKMNFIYEKYESGIYTDEMFEERKAAIDADRKELERMKLENMPKESSSERTSMKQIDVDAVKQNLRSVLHAYQNSQDKTEKNTILRKVFDKVIVEVTERGRGRRPAKFILYPVLKLHLLNKDFLVL
ncbi:recombinase family protein [Paenibacillus sp. Pae108]|uniref:recombinase family protein n=1 Tax=Paenibacillus sp. Pae108 TaxID=2926019 RepID=UPI0021195B51|nr:recombinase family protein [Paenibacillus sp. Pae108]